MTIDENPIAQAILHDPTRYAWTLAYGGGYRVPREVIASTSWPKSEQDVEAVKKSLGVDMPARWNDPGARNWSGANDFVQALVRTGQVLSRPEYLRKLHAMTRAFGMANSNRPDAVLSMMWQPKGWSPNATPALAGYYLNVEVSFYGDGSVLLACEDVDAKTDDIHSLFIFRGCEHQFEHRSGGNCYHIHTCKLCGYRYDIDSGD